MNNNDQLFVAHDRLLHHLARQQISRLTSVGYQMEVDELYSIFCEVYVMAVKTFDDTKGKLTTYLTFACTNRVTRLIQRYFRGEYNTRLESEFNVTSNDDEDNPFSLDYLQNGTDGSDLSILLQDYEIIQELRHEMKKISPFARILIEYTLNPPEFIERELLAQQAKGQIHIDGRKAHVVRPLTLRFVAQCLIKTSEDKEAKRFINKAVEEAKEAVYRAVR